MCDDRLDRLKADQESRTTRSQYYITDEKGNRKAPVEQETIRGSLSDRVKLRTFNNRGQLIDETRIEVLK